MALHDPTTVTFSRLSGEVISKVPVYPNQCVGEIADEVYQCCGRSCKLVYKGQTLAASSTIAHCAFEDDATVQVVDAPQIDYEDAVAYLDEYLIDADGDKSGVCAAAMLIDAEGAAYAAVGDGECGWDLIYADPHEEDILHDDSGTIKKMTVDESKCIIAAFEKKRAPPEGLWIAGKKFTFISCQQDEMDGQKFMVLKMRRNAGSMAYGSMYENCIAIKTGSQYIVALSEEDYDANVRGTMANLNALCVPFAAWMVSEGY